MKIKNLITPGIITLILFPQNAKAGIFDNPVPSSTNDFLDIIWAAQNLMLSIAGAAVFLAVIYSGFLYVTAGGDTQKLEKAKKALLYAFTGLSLVVFSRYLVVTFIKLIGGNVV